MTTALPERPARVDLAVLLALLGIGLWLRLDHLEDAWSYWMTGYARYARPHWLDLGDGVLPWNKLVGMHPPAWALLTAGLVHLGATMRGLLAVPLLAWLASTLVGAALLRRTGRVAPLAFVALMAVAPYQVHYSLELNNYPLFQLGTAGLAVAVAAAWSRPERGRLIALAAVVGANLWIHFAAAPFVLALGVCAVATRRWRVAIATIAGVLLAAPILWEAVALTGASQTFHNEPATGLRLLFELQRVWRLAFVPTWASAALLVATALGGVIALRTPRTRPLAFLLTMALCVGAVWVLAGFSSGASFYRQTPYWIACSWLATALLALGFATSSRSRLLLGALVLLWGFGVLLQPAPANWDLTDGAADRVRSYLAEDVDPAAGDVVVYLWDGFSNDQPWMRDPFYGAVRPGDLVPFVTADEPLALTAGRWRTHGRLVELLGALRPSEPEPAAALTEAIIRWTSDGHVVHLVQPGWEDGRGAPSDDAVRAEVTATGATWTTWTFGRARLTRIER